jgi:oligoendopeptidase F
MTKSIAIVARPNLSDGSSGSTHQPRMQRWRKEMTNKSLPLRSEIAEADTWNGASVFASLAAWEDEFEQVADELSDLTEFQGHLGDSPDRLADWFEALEPIMTRVGRLYVYANMAY